VGGCQGPARVLGNPGCFCYESCAKDLLCHGQAKDLRRSLCQGQAKDLHRSLCQGQTKDLRRSLCESQTMSQVVVSRPSQVSSKVLGSPGSLGQDKCASV
jgi:hypothetical protein